MLEKIERYLGRPWVATGFNCFELVREIYRIELGVELGAVGVDANNPALVCHAFKHHALRAAFRKAEAPENLCVVTMRELNSVHESHCGVFLDLPGAPSVLHNLRGIGVVLDRTDRLSWRNLLISGFYCYL